jgi:hypothetical protein
MREGRSFHRFPPPRNQGIPDAPPGKSSKVLFPTWFFQRWENGQKKVPTIGTSNRWNFWVKP